MTLAFSLLPGLCGSANSSACAIPINVTTCQADIDYLKAGISIANIAPDSYYNAQANVSQFGPSRSWLIDTRDEWYNTFDWHEQLEKINAYPNFLANITDRDGGPYSVHFVGLFSQNSTAIPILLLHGWPGSFLEFLPMLDLLEDRYTPETLPYHVVVPSIPGYAYTTRVEEHVEITFNTSARVLNKLMTRLRFDRYVVQGGDVGSFLGSTMCANFPECVAIHLNFILLTAEQNRRIAELGLTNTTTPEEQERLQRTADAMQTNSAYVYQQGTRPSTTGLAISTSPLATLLWIGEGFLSWVDPRFPLDTETILTGTTLYWLTDSLQRGFWPYRLLGKTLTAPIPEVAFDSNKPIGFSIFPYEINTLPQSWAKGLFPSLAFYNTHDKGGHFAALENPQALLDDLEVFVRDNVK
ncbi:Epoxide hydrolase-like protein 6 [Elsinoe fawcettii]|nr:Epoxide hydrolase-like protein 6 [Elsinoe fawcettii]